MGKKRGRKISLSGPWGKLAHHFGGVGMLADLMGVTTWTIHRYARGIIKPSKTAQVLFDLYVDKYERETGHDIYE